MKIILLLNMATSGVADGTLHEGGNIVNVVFSDWKLSVLQQYLNKQNYRVRKGK